MIDSDGVRLGAEAARRLARTGCCEIGPGLTDAEFTRIEREYDFEFADDHRAFLAVGLPVNSPVGQEEGVVRMWDEPWPDWRGGKPDALRQRLDWPFSGLLFDVRRNGAWHPIRGERPARPDKVLELARSRLAEVPKLVPVYAHRFLPSGHGTSGHPVLSIMQTDIIYYGLDLVDYIHQEFGGPGLERTDERWNPQAKVAFWRDFL